MEATYAEVQQMRQSHWTDHVTQTLEDVLREQEQDMAIALAPVTCTGADHSPTESGQVQFQKCGGGRRIIRKKIGGA